MEALVVVLFILGTALLGAGVAFLVLTWSTLTTHRQAMHALHQELMQRRLAEQRATAAHAPGSTRPPDWTSTTAPRQRRPGDPR